MSATEMFLHEPAALPSAASARRASLRYLNLFRLVMAAVFAVFGRAMGLGEAAPLLFVVVSGAYLVAVLALGFPDVARRFGFDRVVTLQMVIDIIALALLMHATSGASGALPILMMVLLAGGGLVAQGRWVLFYAALATVAVLTENAVRTLSGVASADFFVVGVVCIGFFGVALSARLLARRALANEALAQARGVDLAKQEAINARIIEDMQDGVIVLDAEQRVASANPQAGRLLGCIVDEGVPLAESAPALAAQLATSAKTREAGMLDMGGGKAMRYRTVAAGETGGDRIVYLQDMAQVQAQAQQIKLAALGRLTAGIAHEIRNPLTAVSHAAELLREEKRADGQIRLTRIINDNAQRIEQLVRDVLSLGRRDRAMLEALPLAAFVRDFLDEFTLHGEAEKAQIEVSIDEDVTLAFDRAHLHQILWNLLGNARRYASARPGAIQVRAESRDGRTQLHVLDDGPGIAAEHDSQLFEPFFTTHAKGTGLGLYIARELAEANQASVARCESTAGAHFCLTGLSQP